MSETYADLGGGTPPPRPVSGHRHRYDATSGYCGCGTRDDGTIAPGTPAWRLQQQAVHT